MIMKCKLHSLHSNIEWMREKKRERMPSPTLFLFIIYSINLPAFNEFTTFVVVVESRKEEKKKQKKMTLVLPLSSYYFSLSFFFILINN